MRGSWFCENCGRWFDEVVLENGKIMCEECYDATKDLFRHARPASEVAKEIKAGIDNVAAAKKAYGYSRLTREQKELFERTYYRHWNAMGAEMKAKYCGSKLKQIKWIKRAGILQVLFEDNYWNYNQAGEWY